MIARAAAIAARGHAEGTRKSTKATARGAAEGKKEALRGRASRKIAPARQAEGLPEITPDPPSKQRTIRLYL